MQTYFGLHGDVMDQTGEYIHYLSSIRCRIASFISLFIRDFQSTNQHHIKNVPYLVYEFVFMSPGAISLIASYSLGILSTFLIKYYSDNIPCLLIAWLSSILLLWLPAFLPYKAARFLMGLFFFASSMSLQARIFQIVQMKWTKMNDMCLVNTKNANIDAVQTQSQSESNSHPQKNLQMQEGGERSQCEPKSDSFWGEVLRTFLYNVRPRLKRQSRRPPSLMGVFVLVFLTLLLDLAMFFMKEVIPRYMQKENQFIAISVVSGVWVLLAMQWQYLQHTIILYVNGTPLPNELKHRHPLISTSLSEFWGIRWNPVIMKLLQENYYKPLRRLGVPRLICIVACFAGSAALHAIPQFISTYNLGDALKMGSFFLIHGILILAERLIIHIIPGLDRYFQENFPKPNDKHTSSHLQWLAEGFTVCFCLSTLYIFLEHNGMYVFPFEVNIGVVLSLGMCSIISVLFVYQQAEEKNNVFFSVRGLAILLGYVWTVSCIILSLPLFSIPVYHAFETLYQHSIIVGPLVRALSLGWNKAHCRETILPLS